MNFAGVDLNLLVVLDALHRERSVTRAATRIGLSQSAVSNALSRLRTLLGDRLFVHTGQGMIPTSRGQTIGELVGDALIRINQAVSPAIVFDPSLSKKSFRLATTDYGEMFVIPALVRELERSAPGVTLKISSFDHLKTRTGLQSGEIDLGIVWRIEQHDFNAQGFYTAPLFEEQLVFIVRANHPKVKRRLTLKQISTLKHVVISPTENFTPVVDSGLAQRNLSPRATVVVPHFLSAPFIVAQSDALATVASRVALTFSGTLGIRVLESPVPLPRLSIRMVWHECHHKDPSNEWLRRTLAHLTSKPQAD